MKRKKMILYVSQYDLQKIEFVHALEESGYSVLEATNGESAATALSIACKGGIDLLIMGSRLLAGIESLEQTIGEIGQAHPENIPPIIIHTSYTDPTSIYRGTPLESHIRDYVVKSSDPTKLVAAVVKAIGQPEK